VITETQERVLLGLSISYQEVILVVELTMRRKHYFLFDSINSVRNVFLFIRLHIKQVVSNSENANIYTKYHSLKATSVAVNKPIKITATFRPSE
jgi:hypothetical protein